MLAFAIFLATLVLVIWQPKGLGIGWSALGGAGVALATGVIQPGDIPVVWHIVWDATFAFVALIVISLLLDEAGFFHWAALHVARWGGGRGRRLFPLVVLLGAAIAALFANDGAALLLTPIVLAILLRLNVRPAAALAFIVACGFVADSTSLPLVISNLVNIVSANFFGLTFGRYAAVMVPVNLVSLAATLVVLGAYFRRDLPPTYPVAILERPATAIRDPLVFRAAFPLLAVLLCAYFVTAPFGVPVSLVTGVGAAVLLLLANRSRVIPIRSVMAGAPWQIVLFSLGMYLVVYGLRNAGLTEELAKGLVWLAGYGPLVATLGTGFSAAILSSVMNNMPSVLIGALSIEQAPDLPQQTRELMVYANVIGCDLGPKFTPIGSLATLLWLHVLARKGQTITWGQYMRVGLVITPPVLLATLLALATWLPLLGR
ncbi:arsenical pump membrane protein [Methylorubrum populi BJ001]|jgi:arsenical pump membrane protein|uniref:Arsenical pump membrane protein n=1 Tax=Methylorubrum populi (strain ATCC BAA-705 / NCIMB 13946 / BJ001) TaxID=441620 RepID=B1Z6Z0_METPB|nr:arsenic transporter [Methylorubrum populi]ACB78873.1 arsenical pump membrane protein [Methylorubrum populi BJ001]OAH37729.1 arsenic transporter [Methylorubrum populi]PZP69432.1 MAG: arsenical efflux pump membrane protein ArsB [Methylorubrum populi]